MYSLVNPCLKNKHRYPINKTNNKRNRGAQARDNHPTHGYKRTRKFIKITCITHKAKKYITNILQTW